MGVLADKRLIGFAIAALVSTCLAEDKSQPPPRSITVCGQADIKVAPDQIVLSLAVTTFAPEITKSKADNDERIRKVLAAAAHAQIDAKDIQTGQMSIQPIYPSGTHERRYEQIVGYETESGFRSGWQI